VLTPPNGRLMPGHVAITASDNGCNPPVPPVQLVSVTSSESGHGREQAHRGRPDIVGADLGTPDTLVWLRAEADARRTPRMYTLTYVATDAAGNRTESAATVTVPSPGHGSGDDNHGGGIVVEPVPGLEGSIAGFRAELPGGGNAVIECLDVAGRVLAARELGALPVGVHDLASPWTQRPAAGVYWIRVRQAGEASATRVVILR
jgi:hypothetical protein